MSSIHTRRSCVSLVSLSKRVWLVARRLLSVFNSDKILQVKYKDGILGKSNKRKLLTSCTLAVALCTASVGGCGQPHPPFPVLYGCHGYQQVVTETVEGSLQLFGVRRGVALPWTPGTRGGRKVRVLNMEIALISVTCKGCLAHFLSHLKQHMNC